MNDFASTFASINEYGGVDYAPHNKGVTPVFSIRSTQDFAASEREGRAIYRDVETVLLYVVGDSGTAASHPVDAGIIARFRDQYEAWKRKESGLHIKGMPLSKWPMATPAMIRELESVNVFSVEDLASVSDGNLQNFTNGRSIREMAIAWLKSAKDGAAVMKYAAENERLRDDLKEAMARIAALETHAGINPSQRRRNSVTDPGDRPYSEFDIPRVASSPRKKATAKKGRGWTDEQRNAARERAKARGFGRRPDAGQELLNVKS